MDDLLISRIHGFVLSFISVFCNIIGEGLLKVLGVFQLFVLVFLCFSFLSPDCFL